MTLCRWEDIKCDFQDNLILGNGSSIAVDGGFQYRSIFEKACEKNYLKGNEKEIFRKFKTTDFELILNKLLSAHIINEILGANKSIGSVYLNIKKALIDTVCSFHPKHKGVRDKFADMYLFLESFKTVFSLNSDLLVYWAILAANKKYGFHRFKDCFIDGTFNRDVATLRESTVEEKTVTLVFYPHGALFLGENILGEEKKIIADDEHEEYSC